MSETVADDRNDPARPAPSHEGGQFLGLTKREEIASRIMATLYANPKVLLAQREACAKTAVAAADALLDELNRT